MNESDWNNDFDDNFEEVLRTSVSLAGRSGRFYSKSPVKETLQGYGTEQKVPKRQNAGPRSKKFISLQDFNDMKVNGNGHLGDDNDTLTKKKVSNHMAMSNEYIDGMEDDDADFRTISAAQLQTLKLVPLQKKKSLRFSVAQEEEMSSFEDDFDDFDELPLQEPRQRGHSHGQAHQLRLNSPSRSTSSRSLSAYSESDYTDDNEELIEGIELNNDINLIKQYQLRKERALHQAKLEYETLMKYNSLLHRKVQSSNNISKYLGTGTTAGTGGGDADDEDFMEGFDKLSVNAFQRPKLRTLQQSMPRIKQSQSSYQLRGKQSMPLMRPSGSGVDLRRLKHSASNYFDVYNRPVATLANLDNSYTIKRYDRNDLDNIPDMDVIDNDQTLTRQDQKSIRKLINLANYAEHQSHRKKKEHETGKHRKKGRSKLGLIKQLSGRNGGGDSIYLQKNNDMKYNPSTYRWEGNEADLSKFENINTNHNNSLHTITKKQQGQNYQIVGNMVFNPEKMCWINMDSKEDGYEEDDPFKDLDDLELEMDVGLVAERPSLQRSRRGASSSTVLTSSTMPNSNRLDDINEEEPCQFNSKSDAFQLSRELVHRFRHEESKWNKKVKNWFQPDASYDRDYLYEIRRMVTDNL